MYRILSHIIATIYGSNLSVQEDKSVSTILPRVLSIETRLKEWQQKLQPELKLKPWLEVESQPESSQALDSLFARLSVVMRLRYLSVRILGHRSILCRFLEAAKQSSQRLPSNEEDEQFLGFASHSLRINQECAVETINLIWQMRDSQNMLPGAWWFSIYYTFNACLVLYSILLVLFRQVKHGQDVEPSPFHPSARYSDFDLIIKSLQKGIEAIENIGNGTETAKKMCQTLVKMVQISGTLSKAFSAAFKFTSN